VTPRAPTPHERAHPRWRIRAATRTRRTSCTSVAVYRRPPGASRNAYSASSCAEMMRRRWFVALKCGSCRRPGCYLTCPAHKSPAHQSPADQAEAASSCAEMMRHRWFSAFKCGSCGRAGCRLTCPARRPPVDRAVAADGCAGRRVAWHRQKSGEAHLCFFLAAMRGDAMWDTLTHYIFMSKCEHTHILHRALIRSMHRPAGRQSDMSATRRAPAALLTKSASMTQPVNWH